METTLRFAGDWPALAGTAVSAALAVGMWLLYYRETRHFAGVRRWILPTLRAMAVFLVGWILAGPGLHHEKVIRQLGRLFVFVDSSRSMDLVDKEMPLRRKIALLRAMNLLPDDEILDAAAELSQPLEAHAAQNDDGILASSLERLDAMTRWDRVQQLLLAPQAGVLPTVAKDHDVELLLLRDGEAQPLWWQRRAGRKTSGELPAALSLLPNGMRTDLGNALKTALGGDTAGAGVLLLTDGQHNAIGSSPILLSRWLGENDIPIFAVGVGSTRIPEDMALVGVDGPQSVYADDNIRGEVVLNDRMAAGEDYRLQVRFGKDSVWNQNILSEQSGERRIPFEFPVKQIFNRLHADAEQSGNALRNAPLEFEISITPTSAEIGAREKLADNNRIAMTVQAVTQFRKLLILDGRQRWETRYLRNMFERLPAWEVHAFMDGLSTKVGDASDPNNDWRTSGSVSFPSTRDELFEYELIVFGDLPLEFLTDEELRWMRDYVAKRGGGLIFLDGCRGHLAALSRSVNHPMGSLLPVTFDGNHERRSAAQTTVGRMRLTEAGGQLNALRLVGSDEENSTTWDGLPSPRWIAPAISLPGTRTYLQSQDATGVMRPVLAQRPFGAGRVLYLGSDEFWRWRYQVGDRYHQKFWVQIANWMAYPPYAVDGKFVSLGMDQSVYDPNSSVAFHVTLRDEEGRSITDPNTQLAAVIYRRDRVLGEVMLEDDGNESGIFRGRFDKLAAGRYQIRVRKKMIRGDHEFSATAELVVKETVNREIAELSLNRELLQSMALHSGGEYFDEEQLTGLPDVLNRMDQKKVIRSETSLWDSWWWFVPIMLLLTAEWILRKNAGHI